MTEYAELGPIDYFREQSLPSFRAVGWLGGNDSFPPSQVSPAFFERLCLLLLDPWDPHQFRGFHDCELCPFEPHSYRGAGRKKPEPICVGDRVLSMGRLNLFVPGEGRVYVAPSLIAHYIRTHGYAPPDEFVEAVLGCPEMYSEEYLQARRDLPENEFLKWSLECREPLSREYRAALRAGGAEELANWTPWWLGDHPLKGPAETSASVLAWAAARQAPREEPTGRPETPPMPPPLAPRAGTRPTR